MSYQKKIKIWKSFWFKFVNNLPFPINLTQRKCEINLNWIIFRASQAKISHSSGEAKARKKSIKYWQNLFSAAQASFEKIAIVLMYCRKCIFSICAIVFRGTRSSSPWLVYCSFSSFFHYTLPHFWRCFLCGFRNFPSQFFHIVREKSLFVIQI